MTSKKPSDELTPEQKRERLYAGLGGLQMSLTVDDTFDPDDYIDPFNVATVNQWQEGKF